MPYKGFHFLSIFYIYSELKEECGLETDDLNPAGILMFEFTDDPQLLEVHVFTTAEYSGTVTESDGKY